MTTPHRYAEFLKAFAEGKRVEYYADYLEEPAWLPLMQIQTALFGIHDMQFRIAVSHPTLDKIAKDAWYSSMGKPDRWDAVAKAVSKALDTGEYAP